MAIFYDKVVQLCTDVGITISDFLVKDMGVKKSVGTGWKRGGKPQRANLLKIVSLFGVSEKYLMDDNIPIESGKGKPAAPKWRMNQKSEILPADISALDEKHGGRDVDIIKEPDGGNGQPASGTATAREFGRLEGRIEELEKQVRWYKTEMADILNRAVDALADKKTAEAKRPENADSGER